VHLFPLSVMFGLCSSFLAIAAGCQMWMERLTAPALMASTRAGEGASLLNGKAGRV